MSTVPASSAFDLRHVRQGKGPDVLLIAGLSDAVLKPMMIGHGLEVPMPVILLGVIGGVMAYGLAGLFIGAVLLAVGYVLFIEWLNKVPESKAPVKAVA